MDACGSFQHDESQHDQRQHEPQEQSDKTGSAGLVTAVATIDTCAGTGSHASETGSALLVTTIATAGYAWRTLRLVLPYPPSVNRRYLRGGRRVGAVVLHPQVRAYGETVLAEVLSACGNRRLILPPRTELTLDLQLVPPDRRRRDIDNPLKCLLDCLAYALGVDDSQFVSLSVRRLQHGVGKPGAYVTVAWKE